MAGLLALLCVTFLYVFVTFHNVSQVRCVFDCIDSWYLLSSLLQMKTNALASVALGIVIHRGSYMSTHVLLNLLNDLGKSATSLINSIIQEHEC